MDDKQTKGFISPAEKKRMIEKLEFGLFKAGLQQKQMAKELGISANTVTSWIKALGWKDRLKGRNFVTESAKLKYTENLPGFMLHVKKKHQDKYAEIEKIYQEFIKKY